MAAGIFKQLAKEQGLSYEDKRLFGWLSGFFITLSIVLGNSFRLQVYLPDLGPADQEMDQETQKQIAALRTEAVSALESAAKEHKLVPTSQADGERFIAIEFRYSGKAMKNLGSFLNSAVSAIASLGFTPAKVCHQCGKAIPSGEVPVRLRSDVFPMHDHCAEEVTRQSAWGFEPKKGSVLTGVLGSVLAAIVGAIPWAVVLSLGYVASVTGILIGYMVNKGYDLFHGRQSRVKIAVVVLCLLLSVALGQIAGTSLDVAKAYDETVAGLSRYETMTLTKSEFILWAWQNVIIVEPETQREVLTNFGMGVFFALLGCFGMFLKIARDMAPKRPKRLTASL